MYIFIKIEEMYIFIKQRVCTLLLISSKIIIYALFYHLDLQQSESRIALTKMEKAKSFV